MSNRCRLDSAPNSCSKASSTVKEARSSRDVSCVAKPISNACCACEAATQGIGARGQGQVAVWPRYLAAPAWNPRLSHGHSGCRHHHRLSPAERTERDSPKCCSPLAACSTATTSAARSCRMRWIGGWWVGAGNPRSPLPPAAASRHQGTAERHPTIHSNRVVATLHQRPNLT